MRKLGFGQSVAFVVPEEISRRICERPRKTVDDPIRVHDMLCWSIRETWRDLRRNMPLWAMQGERFERNRNLLCGTATTLEQAQAFLEDEAQTLEARYKPQLQEDLSSRLIMDRKEVSNNLSQIITRCRKFGAVAFKAAALSEEQERELAPEIEEERQIERPPRLIAEVHRVHPDLQYLARTGKLLINSKAFKPAFQALASTSAVNLFDLTKFPTDLLVTVDFSRTVKTHASSSVAAFISDSYQRPVQFILSVPGAANSTIINNLIVISPFEANELTTIIRTQAKVTLHLFSPRSNASYAPLDKLELYNLGLGFTAIKIPRSLTMQLNLFAGSLYLRSFEEYGEVCDHLGLLRAKPKENQEVFSDGFIDPPAGRWGFATSPVPFLRSFLMKIRREGTGVEKTHLGKILSGLRLEEKDFEESF